MDRLIELLATYGVYIGIPLVFLIIVVWVYRPSAKERYQAAGNLPFYGEHKQGKSHQGDG